MVSRSFKNAFLDLRSLKMSGQHRVQDLLQTVFVDLGGLNIWQPSRAEPGQAEPGQAEPGRSEPSRAGPSRTEPSRVGPSRAEPSRAETSRAELSRVKPTLYILTPDRPSTGGPLLV